MNSKKHKNFNDYSKQIDKSIANAKERRKQALKNKKSLSNEQLEDNSGRANISIDDGEHCSLKEDIVNKQSVTLCPSAIPELKNSAVFGVVTGTVDEPHVNYFKQPLPVTDELNSVSLPVTPTEVFRISAECASNNSCKHFDGQNCRLATQITTKLPVVTKTLPSCPIRRECRWWKQEGKSACMRCPQIVTDHYNASEQVLQAAKPVE